jgi:glycosyltransferase involved in cell wall biosynthesis
LFVRLRGVSVKGMRDESGWTQDTDGPKASPSVSVVMPVHNALPFLDESVASILNQTLADFEFVILDDASTDGSADALRRWAQKDGRIRLFRSGRNLGLAGSSNFVVRHARAPFVARMDADDVSHPERLRRQWEVLRGRPDVALVGTLFEGIDAGGRRVRPRDRWRLARRSVFPPFPHGSVMFRREVFDEVGGYREACAGWEDHDLFLRIIRAGARRRPHRRALPLQVSGEQRHRRAARGRGDRPEASLPGRTHQRARLQPAARRGRE